ncbi:extended synaptotagmin-2-like isoform X2 [Penaeus japonicus]|uniref:extended synaptotagmin-2-like isoform X2 n=1 Tax=Penaeus japonicus TaxID=27405 RepID=UPI001C712B22|nr:extended synaptotagmin-2-like isoform X2 [Penaeus japonicus]
MVCSRLLHALCCCFCRITDSVPGDELKVTFPTMESMEWFNIILRQLWPNSQHYVNHLCKTTIEPVLRSALEEYRLTSFSFDEVDLGQIPPRLNGIKVYDEPSLREIVVDVDFEYFGDSKIKASVSELSFGIDEIKISGRLRVVLKPLIGHYPLVGGVHVLFLESPHVSYNLTGSANVFDLPGLRSIIRRALEEQIEQLMVMPNRLPIQIANDIDVAEFNCPIPAGVVRLHIVEAENLTQKDFSILNKGKSDPYCIMRIGLQNFRTEIFKNTTNPKWDACKEYVCSSDVRFGNEIHFEVYDHDRMTDDDFLLMTSLSFQEIWKNEIDTWLPLTETDSGRLHIKATWYDLSDSADSLQTQLEEMSAIQLPTKKPLHSAVLVVWVDSVRNLNDHPGTYVRLSVDDLEQATKVSERANDPLFRQGFVFLVRNPWTQKLVVEVVEQKHSRPRGKVEVDLNTILNEPKLEVRGKEFALEGDWGGTATLRLNITLRILKKTVAEDADCVAAESE